jgi:lipid II:glycine glycyltransferase (peptidoglycan interpeptide bridge formation enzyme)
MEIQQLKIANHKQYEEFVQHHQYGSLFQSLLWQQYQQEAFGRKSMIFIGQEKGKIVNSALVMIHPLPFHKNYLYAPRGPLFSDVQKQNDQLLESISKIAKEQQSIFFLFDPLMSSEIKLEKYLTVKYCKPSISHQPKTTLLLDITKSDEEILAQMKEKGRYNIRLAEKKGVKVREGNIEELYPLFLETSKRDGFHIHSKHVYEKMLSSLHNNILLLVAEYEGRVISAGIFTFYHNVGTYYYGASSNEYRNVMAPYLIQWRAIQEAKKRGCTTYDFLGIADEGVKNHPWASVTEFKLKFGGKKEKYIGAFEITYASWWSWFYHWTKKIYQR